MAGAEALAAIAKLADPVRRQVFDLVRQARAPLTRDQVATAAGISRNLAAFHLDKLVNAAFLRAELAAKSGRLGRRPKVYSLSDREISVTIPARDYALAAEVFADALASIDPQTATPAIASAAAARGRERGERAASSLRGRLGRERALTATDSVLEDAGFGPVRRGPGELELTNCPFHRLAQRNRLLACRLNQAYVTGIVEGLGGAHVLRVELAPAPDRCCVRLVSE